MSLTSNAKRFARTLGSLPVVAPIVRHPSVRRGLEKIPGAEVVYGSGWSRTHPFDRAHGTDTSGFVSTDSIPVGEAARAHAIFYAGSQPSVLRTALGMMLPLESFTFVDLGCGKGRAVLVASEYPFRDILGIELSPALTATARRNAAIMARRFPRRTPVRVESADASSYPLPSGDLILFLYHPFGAELVSKVVDSVEAALAAEQRSIYVVYYNPANHHCFDASTALRRRFASMVAHTSEELGFSPDDSNLLVIWQGGTSAAATAAANARIVVRKDGMRATLEGSTAHARPAPELRVEENVARAHAS